MFLLSHLGVLLWYYAIPTVGMNWNDITRHARVWLRVQKKNNNENVSINFFRKCPEIKQVTINIQCINIKFIFIKIINNNFRNAPSESIFVSVAPFEFRIMTSGNQQRLLCYRLNVNPKRKKHNNLSNSINILCIQLMYLMTH